MNKPNIFKREINYVLLLLPALLIYCTFFIYPTLKTAVYSFTNWSDVHPVVVKYVGLNNYIALFKDSLYLTGISNTLIYAVLAMLGQNLLAIPLAVFLNKRLKQKICCGLRSSFLRCSAYWLSVFSGILCTHLPTSV